MKPRRNPTPTLTRLLRDQEGTVTRAQALPEIGEQAIGRLLAHGQWSVVTPGAYAETRTPTVRHRLWTGHLLGGAGSALGGEAALFVAGIRPEPALVQTWVPPGVRRDPRREPRRDPRRDPSAGPGRQPGWVFPRDGLGRLANRRGTLPVIRTDEAVVDVGQTLDTEGWVELLTTAARKQLVSLAEVERRIRQRPRVSNRALMLAVIADLTGIESNLEWAYLRDVEQRHGLPTASRQVVVIAGSRADVRYDACSVIVELDGKLHLDQEFRDLERDNAHAARDETTLRYGSRDVRGRPCAVAWQVGGVLARNGWVGVPLRCPDCPPEAEARRLAGRN